MLTSYQQATASVERKKATQDRRRKKHVTASKLQQPQVSVNKFRTSLSAYGTTRSSAGRRPSAVGLWYPIQRKFYPSVKGGGGQFPQVNCWWEAVWAASPSSYSMGSLSCTIHGSARAASYIQLDENVWALLINFKIFLHELYSPAQDETSLC